MAITFSYPWLLLLLLAIPLLWFYPRRLEGKIQGALRSALFASLILALSGPVFVRSDSSPYQVLIVDDSTSITAQGRAQSMRAVNDWLLGLHDNARAAVVVIDGGGEVDLPPAGSKRFGDVGTVLHLDDKSSRSPLGAGLETAARQIPQGGSGVITVVSDEVSTGPR